MDLLTHALLGASCACVILGTKESRVPAIVGAIAALIPDLDILARFFSTNPLSTVFWHRNFTHSLAFIPFGGVFVALIFLMMPYFRKKWQITIEAAVIGIATHGLLDACTSYGTLLYWPWSTTRISWDLISIIDPLFTIILALGLSWSLIFRERKMAGISLLLGILCLLFNSAQQQRALAEFQAWAKKKQLKVQRIKAMPTLGSSTVWRVIAVHENCLLLTEITTSLISNNQMSPIISAPLYNFNTSNLPAEQRKAVAIFSWFTDNYLVIARKNPLLLADGRYTVGKRIPINSLWGIALKPQCPYFTLTGAVALETDCKLNSKKKLECVSPDVNQMFTGKCAIFKSDDLLRMSLID